MIPYDDLVAALAAWRAKQGLPVAGLPGTPPTPPPRAPAPPPPAARITPHTARTAQYSAATGQFSAAAAPYSAPARTTPTAMPARTTATGMPVPSASNELRDFDEDAGGLIEEVHYGGGDDYVPQFEPAGEATAIGEAPEAPTEGLLVPKRGKRPPGR